MLLWHAFQAHTKHPYFLHYFTHNLSCWLLTGVSRRTTSFIPRANICTHPIVWQFHARSRNKRIMTAHCIQVKQIDDDARIRRFVCKTHARFESEKKVCEFFWQITFFFGPLSKNLTLNRVIPNDWLGRTGHGYMVQIMYFPTHVIEYKPVSQTILRWSLESKSL